MIDVMNNDNKPMKHVRQNVHRRGGKVAKSIMIAISSVPLAVAFNVQVGAVELNLSEHPLD